jgi:gamma-glutamyl:cysteine ligase YbdK (ATP-grasp superfamily)
MMRFTIVDCAGTISFPGPPHALKALAASCSAGADNHRALLESLASYDADLSASVLNGLAVFDEHVIAANTDSVRNWFTRSADEDERPLRVVDEATRRISLEPRRLGVVIFNLAARRIVQVQNSYAELLRADRGRVRVDGRPTARLYRYSLPNEWLILP